jgi:DNA-binding transcriptional LysR family regulator
MAPFLLEHPGLEVAVDLDDRRVDFLAGGYDMAIRIGSVESGNFIARRLAASPLVLVASPTYLAALGAPQVPADLLRHELLGYAYVAGSQALNFAARAGRPALSLRVRPRLVANNGQFMLEAARGGVGIAPVPAWMLQGEDASRGLQQVLVDWPLQGSDVYALYARSRQPSLKVKALVDYLAGALGGLGG